MLALTPTAAQAIDTIISQPNIPDTAGLRLSAEATTATDAGAPQQELRISVVEAPEEGDEVLEEAPLYIEPTAAEFLDDKLLDADVAQQQVRFSLHEQGEAS